MRETQAKVFEEWKQELYACPSVYKAFSFFDKLALRKPQLSDFAEYLGVSVYRYSDKTGIIRRLVYATVGEKLKDDPIRRRNIEKYRKDTAHNGVIFVLCFADGASKT